MSLRLNKEKLIVVKVLYVLIALFSIPIIIFKPMWYIEQQNIVQVPYSSTLLQLIYGAMSLSFVFISLIMLFRLEFGGALIFGLISTVSIILDLNAFLISYQLHANSGITYYSIMIIASIIIVNIYLLFSIYYHNEKDKRVIKKMLLDLGTQYSRLEIVDIAEKSSMNREKVERIVIEMLNKKEIYGEYLASKKLIKLNVDLNIEEIDNLLEIYKKWENQVFFKKIE